MEQVLGAANGFAAIVMILVFVGVVHALLREKDKLIMLLAAVVGLALTFGPYLVVM